MPEPLVSHVSDTARWVAAYRAAESARPDALFKDPLADRVAGERGRAIVAGSPRRLRSGWSIVSRTKLIDDSVRLCLASGCDRVLNLAAGMDTRPYRLPLPASLTWIEADLPALLDEKERLLEGEKPSCTLLRERVDLSDAAARAAFLARFAGGSGSGSGNTLVITEGLLGYLNAEVARDLARDLAAQPAIRWWIMDLFSPGALRMLKRVRGHGAAPLLNFAPPEGVAFFEAHGWKARDVSSIWRAAVRFRRAPLKLYPLALLADPDPRRLGRHRWFGVIRYERA
jgi:methyltransferase (TIGR00027 family)